MKQKLKEELKKLHPFITDKMALRYVDKYVAAVMSEIAKRFMLMSSDEVSDGEMNFSAKSVDNASGRYKISGRTGYVYHLMQEHPATSLIISAYKGNSVTHRVSRVIFNPIYKKEIMEELGSLIIECEPKRLKELQDLANHSVEIDPESLASYIKQTKLSLKNRKGQAYDEKLLRNLQIANQLQVLVRDNNGVAYLDEYWDEIDSGRIHGHGLSLQRIPKEVRHAALGRCYRYDFKAASYALMTSFARQIDPTLKTGALQDYIKNRSVIRRRIAKDIGISEEWMKEIFTSVGFGAQLKDNPYNSIRKKIGQEKYHKLLCNAEFMCIKSQLDQVSAVILNSLGKGDFELFGKTYAEINPKDKTKRTKNQKLAWLYQCLESGALNMFVNMIPENYKIKLLVHDCAYLDKPLSAQQIADIKYALMCRYEFLNFEGDAIIPIHASDYVCKYDQDIDRAESDHRAHMVVENSRANSQNGGTSNAASSVKAYASEHCTISAIPFAAPKRQIMTHWGMVDADMLSGD
ncbi:hypothetical protein [Sapientia aquatica]|uniref:Uncharacterized protein n=1 Tax=Sapientia aquatica TaxID=1549640 RepID=A0A4R5VXH1_9BURK|nr:hypothetical protein [Sapientia aquatica]TDK63706.1 hypothetical protein E2I14_14115 [Sapientia aquatica]